MVMRAWSVHCFYLRGIKNLLCPNSLVLLDESCQTWIGEQSKIQSKIQSKSQSIVQSPVFAFKPSRATDLYS